ncbi:GNAT family N-acetyltransferase, partial [bacterium M00.F.Ca.ET.179.01.1.1]
MNPTQATVAPVIETPRTILRPHQLGDFDAYATMW